jgi:hypothetical protein
VHWAPGIPRALCFQKGERFLAKLGRLASRGMKICLQLLGRAPPSQPSSSGLTGRSSIPETSVIDPRKPGVLDAPLSRGMTAVLGRRYWPSLRGALATKQSSLPHSGMVRRTRPGISRFSDVQLHIVVRCCASPRNDGLKRIASLALAMTPDERTRLFDSCLTMALHICADHAAGPRGMVPLAGSRLMP